MSYLEQRRKFIEDGRPLPPKKKYVIPKKSAKRFQKEKEQGIEIVKPKKAGWFDEGNVFNVEKIENRIAELLEQWFQDRHKEMTGICKNCGGKTQKGQKNYKNSIAHILPKAYFLSVSTHPDNFIELCFYGESCHTNMDNKTLDLIDMNCFDEIVEKVTRMYTHIAPEERRRIPAILREYIKTEI